MNSGIFPRILLDCYTSLDNSEMHCNPLQSSSVSSLHPFLQIERGSPWTMPLKPFKDEYCCDEKATRLSSGSFELGSSRWAAKMFSADVFESGLSLAQALTFWLHSARHKSGCCPRSVCRCQRRSQNQRRSEIATATQTLSVLSMSLKSIWID